MADESKKSQEYEVVLNTGGGSVMSSRVSEEVAGRVAMAFGMNWPSPCVIRWPLIIRQVGVRPDIEGQALASALREVVEIPEGEIVIWIAGKKGAIDAEVYDQGEGKETIPTQDKDGVLEEVKKVLDECGPEWGWLVRSARAGEVLTK